MITVTKSDDFALWQKIKDKRFPLSFDLDLTARCNFNCSHCYINLPANDRGAAARELRIDQLERISSEAVALGALCCLISGGEPLLRDDFKEIYLMLKKQGLLVSVFTNASLVRPEHIELFRRYPPTKIEVSVYGVTKETYEKVTRKKGGFDMFMKGLELLRAAGIKVSFKAMALRGALPEMSAIADFCRKRSDNSYRFDPQLHLRYDGDPGRNREIAAQRLTPEEIVALEKADPERSTALQEKCDTLINDELSHYGCGCLFHCGAGESSFSVSYDGIFRLCSSLQAPECLYDLKSGTLRDAWENFAPRVKAMQSDSRSFREKCRKCPLINICLWCPAHSYLETGKMDRAVDYFCQVAHARAGLVRELKKRKYLSR